MRENSEAQKVLRVALESIVESGCSEKLEAVIAEHPSVVGRLEGEYPDVHRIIDARTKIGVYRVLRKISDGERIGLYEIESSKCSDVVGVPIGLTESGLQKWAVDAVEEPFFDEPDWSIYMKC